MSPATEIHEIVLRSRSKSATVMYAISLKQGYLDGLAVFLKSNIFPALSDGVNYILSNIVGWAFSGVVGGFVYDLLKRLYGDKKEK